MHEVDDLRRHCRSRLLARLLVPVARQAAEVDRLPIAQQAASEEQVIDVSSRRVEAFGLHDSKHDRTYVGPSGLGVAEA